MTPGEIVHRTRAALAELAGAGAVSATAKTVETWRALAAHARGLALPALGERLAAVAAELAKRGAFAYEPSRPLADAALGAHDLVEALASHLELELIQRDHGNH